MLTFICVKFSFEIQSRPQYGVIFEASNTDLWDIWCIVKGSMKHMTVVNQSMVI